MAPSLGLLLIFLYATSAKLEPVPRLPYVYKHIAVTRYLELHGATNSSIDIYNRWPGFFAFAAYLGKITGFTNPVSYAAWAEPVFMAVAAMLVGAIAKSLCADPRVYWAAPLLFILLNWIGQNYFSPQAFGFTFYLAACLLAFTFLRRKPFAVGRKVEDGIAFMLRSRDLSAASAPTGRAPRRNRHESRRNRIYAITAILLLQVVITASHQLTPYLLALGLVPLFAVGYFRPIWLAALVAAIPVLYLIPNLSYVQHHFGLFTGLNPVSNATYTPIVENRVIRADIWHTRGTDLLTVLAYGLGVLGFARRAHAGDVRTALMAAWLAFAPTMTLFSQSYGGEGRLRIVLFALPWLAIGAAWSMWPRAGLASDQRRGAEREEAKRGPLKVASLAVVVIFTVIAAVAIPTSLQPETELQVSAADVNASDWLDSQYQPHDVLLASTAVFPRLIGAHYDYIVNTNGALSSYRRSKLPMTVTDVAIAISRLASSKSTRAYIVFSSSQTQYGSEHGLFAVGELSALERALQTSPKVRTVYNRDGAQVLELPIS
jgi:hypothetical protein